MTYMNACKNNDIKINCLVYACILNEPGSVNSYVRDYCLH